MCQNNSGRLVFATDGSHKNLCNKCNLNPCQCCLDQEIIPAELVLKIRIEKKGRGGKSVSVLFELPQNEKYWIGLTKKLKAHCGSGGAYKKGMIEIQGDHRDKLTSYLEKMGFLIKLGGG
ncbi:MAG: hypothetical protein K0U40_08855 [Betaproteobacteria bacterium]|nr:hypothetical protein [Betaproteobacteria bacterium]